MRSLRPSVEGALLAAIAVVLYLASVYIPVLGFLLTFLCPLPVMFLVIRWNLRTGLLASVVATAIVFAFAGVMQALISFVGFSLVGMAMGALVKRGKPFFEVIALSAGVSILSKLALIGLAMALTGIHPITTNIAIMEEAYERASQWLGGAGEENFQNLLNLIQMALPAILIIASILDTALNFFLGKWVGKKIGVSFPESPAFDQWRFPRSVFWMFALSWILVLFGGTEGVGRVGVNLQMVTQTLFLVQGLSLAYFFLKKYIPSRVVSIGLLVFVVFQPILTFVVSWAGILDTWLDLRKIEKKPPSG